MNKIELEIPTQEELAAKMAATLVTNAENERLRLAAENRLAGRSKPEPGDRFYVTTAVRPGRSRAGCMFSPDKRTEVRIALPGDALGPVKDGEGVLHYVVDVHGGEMILADNALSFSIVSADQVDAADLRRQIATRDQRIAALEAENARIVREARMAAVDKGDGSPSRLAAARKAGRQTDDGFGGKE
jgi:hypothetical protein